MTKGYFELRGNVKQGNINLAADLARHLHARQYLGKTVVICEHPAIFLTAVHKQWYKLSRSIQQRRAGSLDADKILKYTHAITHMQHMRFSAKTPLEEPDAAVYFMRPEQLSTLPPQCLNMYVTTSLTRNDATALLAEIAADALIVDYTDHPQWKALNVTPKKTLELALTQDWQRVQQFLAKHEIDVRALFDGTLHDVDAMDNALDTLLAHSHSFLQTADDFRHALELARPLRLSKSLRDQYDTLIILAHRVQALSSSSFTQRFLETYNEDDTFLLYDSGTYLRRANVGFESLTETIARHLAAGRHHLATALRTQAIAQ